MNDFTHWMNIAINPDIVIYIEHSIAQNRKEPSHVLSPNTGDDCGTGAGSRFQADHRPRSRRSHYDQYLADVMGLGWVDEDDLYVAMDWLLESHERIELRWLRGILRPVHEC